MGKEFILKKNIFGGFDRRQVIEYISQLQSQCQDIQSQTEIEEIKNKIDSFKKAIDDKDRTISKLNEELEKLNTLNEKQNAVDSLKGIAEADKIISAARAEAEEYITKTKLTYNSNKEKFEALFLKLTSLNAELLRIGTNFENISKRINEVRIDDTESERNIEEPVIQPVIFSEPEIGCVSSIKESFAESSDSDYEPEEAVEPEIEFIPDDIESGDIPDSFNYIDNFFAELEKLTGADNFDDADITQITDSSFEKVKQSHSDKIDLGATDESFDELLKNVFTSENQ